VLLVEVDVVLVEPPTMARPMSTRISVAVSARL